jgi:microcystin-dependent protein
MPLDSIDASLSSGIDSIGSIQVFVSGQVPSGYLICNGQTVSRTGYSGLFSVCGTTFGAGDGSTTFALPTMTGPVTNTVYAIKCKNVLPSVAV